MHYALIANLECGAWGVGFWKVLYSWVFQRKKGEIARETNPL